MVALTSRCDIMRMILVLIGASTLLLADAVPSLVLTSVPSSSEPYCPGPVIFTCNATEISVVLQWELDNTTVGIYTTNPTDRYPLNVNVTSPLIDSIQINSVTIYGNSLDLISTLRVSDVSVLEGSSLHCGDKDLLNRESNAVNFIAIYQAPPPPPFDCSNSILHNLILQWSEYFNTNYSVEKYHVNITPDTSSCSSDQVPPDSDYICSGLEQGTEYSISVSAINCQSQEGMISSFNVTPQASVLNPPEIVNVKISEGQLTVVWQEGSIPVDSCYFSGVTNYTVFLNDSTMIVEEKIVNSDICINGTCTIILNSSNLVCYISILVKNGLFQSNVTVKDIDFPRLTLTNNVLLGLGVTFLICIIIMIVGPTLVYYFTVQKWKRVAVFLVGGAIPAIVLTVLYVAFALLVALQANRCDADWQSMRNNMLIAIFILSLITTIIVVIVCTQSKVQYEPDKVRETEEVDTMVNEFKLQQENNIEGTIRTIDDHEVIEMNHIICKFPCIASRKYNLFLHHNEWKFASKEIVGMWLASETRWSKDYLGNGQTLTFCLVNDCPDKWKYQNRFIDAELIVEFLSTTWNNCFTIGPIENAQIRIFFQDEIYGNWSVIGSLAKKVKEDRPTMELNFDYMSDDEIRANIVHQFGHALGLGHALMPPEDWDLLEEYFDIDVMVKAYGLVNVADFKRQWIGMSLDERAVNYDEESVMHYSASSSLLKVGASKNISSQAKEKMKKFKKHETLRRHTLSSRDEETLRTLHKVYFAPMSMKDMDKYSGLADSWKSIAQYLGISETSLKVIEDVATDNKMRLNLVWNKWFNVSEDVTAIEDYPPTWEGLHKLLEKLNKMHSYLPMSKKDLCKIFESNLAASWESIAQCLELTEAMLKVVEKASDNEKRLDLVWNTWFSKFQGHTDYPPTWEGLYRLLEKIGKRELIEKVHDYMYVELATRN